MALNVGRYEDRFWTSRDGLKLHYRDYPGDTPGHLPVICLHGLTRNARDFEGLAAHLSPAWHVLCPEMRGRGDSEYARDSATYTPLQYLDDLEAFFAETGIERFVAIGTSMGALLTMGVALTRPDRIAGFVFNDVGPVLERHGLSRIKDYVGQGRSFPTWVHAARGLEQMQGAGHPGRDLGYWIRRAKQSMTLSSNGRIVFDYDMKVAEPFATFDPAAQPDLWPAIDALAGKPALVVRGAMSDLLSAETLAAMAQRLPGCETVTVPNCGHAPDIDDPLVLPAIERLLARVG